jgi:aspartyl-tRNA(Asn)/glutamyl-tRNA(Gln) amidotransferase subunit A
VPFPNFKPICALLGAVTLTATSFAQPRTPPREITQVTGDLYRARNGNWYTVFLVTPAGIILGTYALSSGYYDAYYGQAQKVRTLITRDFEAAFERADVLVSPTTPTTAFRLGERVDDPLAMYLADLCTIPSNLAGNASMSMPVGLAPEDGLPVGLQVIAPPLADDRLYRVGGALEAALADTWGHLLIHEAPELTPTAAEAAR